MAASGPVPQKPSKRAQEVMRWIAGNVRRLRVRAGLTQDGLAEAADVDTTFVQKLERAVVNPTIGKLTAVADALGVPPGALLRQSKMHAIVKGRPPRKKSKPKD